MNKPDHQKHQVYESDRALDFFGTPDFKTSKAVAAYVKELWSKPEVAVLFPDAFRYPYECPEVIEETLSRPDVASATHVSIYLPSGYRSSAVVMHELAHVVCFRTYAGRVEGHGKEYASIYLQLTRLWLGEKAHEELRRAFRKNKVKWVPYAATDDEDARIAGHRAAAQAPGHHLASSHA